MEFAFYALGYYYLNRSNQKEKQLRQAEQQKSAAELTAAELALEKVRTEQELLQMENNFLRAQINPHFLHNTLNVLYSQALESNRKLAENIVALSDIMRYSLDHSKGNDLVPLLAEADQINRIIQMYQLRYDDTLHIEFNLEGRYDDIYVLPLTCITLVENALKYGDLHSAQSPLRIWLAADSQRIYFTVNNKISSQEPESSHGIGMGNLRKRLSNLYGSHYQLGVEQQNGHYHAALVIEHTAALRTNGPVPNNPLRLMPPPQKGATPSV